MSCTVSRRPILVAMALFGTVPPVWSDPAALERALLAGDWRALQDALGGVQPGEAAWRTFLRGHAALALNRNDESVQQFLSVSTPAAIGEWDAWTAKNAERNADSSSAWYLRGDALARREAWGDATAAFTRALKLGESNGLAWNARGVVHALKGRWKEAGDDFAAAIARQPELADPYANTGIAYVLQSIGRKETRERTFDKALQRSPEFRLARLGAAGLQFGIGNWQLAASELESLAGAKDPIGSVAARNLAVVRFAERETLLQGLGGELVAGTSVTVQSGARQATEFDALNQRIMRNEVAAAGFSQHDRWAKESVAALSLIGKVVPLAKRFTDPFSAGVTLSAIGSGDASRRLSQQADVDRAAFNTGAITRTMENYKGNPKSEGYRTAAINWLNSAQSVEARNIGLKSGLQASQLDGLVGSGPKAGGAILSFQKAHTSRGAWGMYVPFGLVYTGIAGAEAPQGGGNGSEGAVRR